MIHFWWDKHPFTSYFDVHQGYQGFGPSPNMWYVIGMLEISPATFVLLLALGPTNLGPESESSDGGNFPSFDMDGTN